MAGHDAQDDRVVCRNPVEGKQPTRIAAWKFNAVRDAILAVVPTSGEGLRWTELTGLVKSRLSDDERARLGSVGWYTVCVKLELEVRGEIVRVAGARPQRLLRTA